MRIYDERFYREEIVEIQDNMFIVLDGNKFTRFSEVYKGKTITAYIGKELYRNKMFIHFMEKDYQIYLADKMNRLWAYGEYHRLLNKGKTEITTNDIIQDLKWRSFI